MKKANESNSHIVINFTDNNEETKLSENEKKAIKIAKEVRDRFSIVATEAINELQYLKAHKGYFLYGEAKNLKWIFDLGEQTSSKELIDDLETPETTSSLRKDFFSLNKLKEELDKLPLKDGFAKIGLKRIREKDGTIVGYLPVKELGLASSELSKTNGAAEYMLENEGGVKITQDTINYLTVALLGGMSNELDRVRVSDLRKRIGKKF